MDGAGEETRGTGDGGRRTRRDGSSSMPAWRATPTNACSTLATVVPGSTPASDSSPASVRTVMFMLLVCPWPNSASVCSRRPPFCLGISPSGLWEPSSDDVLISECVPKLQSCSMQQFTMNGRDEHALLLVVGTSPAASRNLLQRLIKQTANPGGGARFLVQSCRRRSAAQSS